NFKSNSPTQQRSFVKLRGVWPACRRKNATPWPHTTVYDSGPTNQWARALTARPAFVVTTYLSRGIAPRAGSQSPPYLSVRETVLAWIKKSYCSCLGPSASLSEWHIWELRAKRR